MTKDCDELENLHKECPVPQSISEKWKSNQPIPLGDQRKAVLRQEFMTVLINLGVLIGGMSLALPAVTLDHLTNPAEIFHLNKSQSSWFASASSIACPLGSFSCIFLVDRFGRRNTVIFVNILAIFAWTLMSTAFYDEPSYVFLQLMVSRFLSGIATGMGGTPATVYGAEVCLPKLRGRLTMVTSMAIASGVLFAYVVGFFLRTNWRLIGLIFLAYQVACLVLMIPVKESPNWLLSKGRFVEAKASLSYFRGLDIGETHEEVEAEFDLLKQSMRPKAGEKNASFWKSLRLPEVYKPFLIGISFFVFQQFSGTFVVVVYAVQIITRAGVLADSFLIAIYVGIARLFVSSVVMTWELEKWNRRQVSTFSAASTAVCLFLLAGSSWFTWMQIPTLSAAVIVGFVVASAGLWTIPFTILPEMFPQKVRGAFTGASIGFGYVISFFSIKVYPSLMDLMGNGNVFAFYGFVALLTILFVHRFVPETKGKTFAEIGAYFRMGKKTIRKNEDELATIEVLVIQEKK